MFKNRYWKLFFVYFFSTVILLVLIFVFGMKTAVKLSEVFQNRQSMPASSLYQNTLPEPQFQSFPLATNSAEFNIAGFSLANQKVEFYLDDDLAETISVDAEGRFNGKIILSLGVNNLYAVTVDNQNQKSLPSAYLNILYKNTPPLLEVIEPENNILVKKNPSLFIRGKTENETKVYINSRLVVTDSGGIFSLSVRLSEGKNIYKISAVDIANNVNEKELIVNFQP